MLEISRILVFILICFLYLMGWVVSHLLCEYKHLWCKGKCMHCRNWRCKYFKTNIPEEFFSCSKGDAE